MLTPSTARERLYVFVRESVVRTYSILSAPFRYFAERQPRRLCRAFRPFGTDMIARIHKLAANKFLNLVPRKTRRFCTLYHDGRSKARKGGRECRARPNLNDFFKFTSGRVLPNPRFYFTFARNTAAAKRIPARKRKHGELHAPRRRTASDGNPAPQYAAGRLLR